MSPDGSNPDCHDWTRSGFVLCDLPPLSCGWMGGLFAQLLKYSRKETCVTCCFSHHLCQSHRDRGGGWGGCRRVPGVNSATHACWPLGAAYLHGRRQLRGGRRFWMWLFGFIKSFSNIVPLHPLLPPSSTYFKMWTCQSNASMSNLMWLIYIFSSISISKS